MTILPSSTAAQASTALATVLWDTDKPVLTYLNIPEAGLMIGRELLNRSNDDRLSRQHARVVWHEGHFEITDLGSRNGTHVAGNILVHRTAVVATNSIVRTGRTIMLLSNPPHNALSQRIETIDGLVIGPSTANAWTQLSVAATHRRHILISGEHGTGKTRYARALVRRTGEAVAIFDPEVHAIAIDRLVGKATTLIVEQIERLTQEHLTSLASVLATQPKLRIICTSSVVPDQLQLPSFLHSLHDVTALTLPSLRSRFDEIPTLVVNAVTAAEPALAVHSTMIETCLLRGWPGNVAELLSEVTRCAHAVASQGKSHIRSDDLSHTAGQLMHGNPTLLLAALPPLTNVRKSTEPEES